MDRSILQQLRAASRARDGAGVTVQEVADATGRTWHQTRRRLRGVTPSGEAPNVDPHGRCRSGRRGTLDAQKNFGKLLDKCSE
jgi:predicted transcriptional regulator